MTGDLNHGHHDQLDRAGGANDHSEGDQHCCTREVSADQVDDVDINEGSVGVAVFVVDNLNIVDEKYFEYLKIISNLVWRISFIHTCFWLAVVIMKMKESLNIEKLFGKDHCCFSNVYKGYILGLFKLAIMKMNY